MRVKLYKPDNVIRVEFSYVDKRRKLTIPDIYCDGCAIELSVRKAKELIEKLKRELNKMEVQK